MKLAKNLTSFLTSFTLLISSSGLSFSAYANLITVEETESLNFEEEYDFKGRTQALSEEFFKNVPYGFSGYTPNNNVTRNNLSHQDVVKDRFFTAGESDDRDISDYFESRCSPKLTRFEKKLQTFGDVANNVCSLSAKGGVANYCECINVKVPKQEFSEKSADDVAKLKIENSNKIKKAIQTRLFSDAIFEFISSAQRVGYGLVGNQTAAIFLKDSSKEAGMPMCTPGNLSELFKVATENEDGSSCFSDGDSEDIKELVSKFVADKKESFNNLEFKDADSLYSGNPKKSSYFNKKGKDVLETLIRDSEATISHDYEKGLKRIGLIKEDGRFVKDGSTIDPLKAMRLKTNYAVLNALKDLSEVNLDDSDSYEYDGILINNIVQDLVNDPTFQAEIDKEKLSFINTVDVRQTTVNVFAKKDLPQSAIDLTKGQGFLGKELAQSTSSLNQTPFLTSSQMRNRERFVVGVDIAKGLMKKFRKALKKGEDESLTSEELVVAMNNLEAARAQEENERCQRAFKKLKKSCSIGTVGLFNKGMASPDVLVSTLDDYAAATNMGQDEYVQLHMSSGDLFCQAKTDEKLLKTGDKANFADKSISKGLGKTGNHDTSSYEDGKLITGNSSSISEGSFSGQGSAGSGSGGASADPYLDKVVDANYPNNYDDMEMEDYDLSSFKDSAASMSNMASYTPSNNYMTNYAGISNIDKTSVEGQNQVIEDLGNASQNIISSNNAGEAGALAKVYEDQIREMREEMAKLNEKLDAAEEERNQSRIEKLNSAISNATQTIEKLQKDKQNLIQRIAGGPSEANPFNRNQAVTSAGAQVVTEGELKRNPAGGVSGTPKAQALSSNRGESFISSANGTVDKNGYTKDDYLIRLRDESMQSQEGAIITLSSLSSPDIGKKVKTAFQEGNRMIYANVDGAVYRIIPQVDEDGKIIEKNGEVQFITEIVGDPLKSDSEKVAEKDVKKKAEESTRSPASKGIKEQGLPGSDIEFGYDTMMNLTEDALDGQESE